MLFKFCFTLILVAAVLKVNDAAKIVVYNPHFAHSHFAFMAKLSDILQDAGHNVVSSMCSILIN